MLQTADSVMNGVPGAIIDPNAGHVAPEAGHNGGVATQGHQQRKGRHVSLYEGQNRPVQNLDWLPILKESKPTWT